MRNHEKICPKLSSLSSSSPAKLSPMHQCTLSYAVPTSEFQNQEWGYLWKIKVIVFIDSDLLHDWQSNWRFGFSHMMLSHESENFVTKIGKTEFSGREIVAFIRFVNISRETGAPYSTCYIHSAFLSTSVLLMFYVCRTLESPFLSSVTLTTISVSYHLVQTFLS